LASVGENKMNSVINIKIDFNDRQRLQTLEEKILDVKVILESTLDTVTQLSVLHDLQIPDGLDNTPMGAAFLETVRETKQYVIKARALQSRIQAAGKLVGLALSRIN
jgi:hypothetical protein